MPESKKTKQQLLEELATLRARIDELEKSSIKSGQIKNGLLESEERFSLALEAVNDGLWDWNLKTGEAYFSPRYFSMLGYAFNEMAPGYDMFKKLVHPDDIGLLERELEDHFRSKSEWFIMEFRMRAKSGAWVWIGARGKVVERDREGNPVRMVGTHTDITRRRQAEEALRKSEQRYRKMVEHVSYAVAVYRPVDDGRDFIIIDLNPAGERIEQVRRADIIGRSVQHVFGGVREFGIFDVFQRVWRTGTPEHFPVGRYKDERIIGWRDNFIYKLPSGELVAVYTDETARMQAEEALRLKTEELDRFFNFSLDLLCIADTQGYFRKVNFEWEQVLGYTRDELEDRPFMDFVHSDDREKTMEAVADLSAQREVHNFVNRYRGKDGSYRWLEWRSYPAEGGLIYAAARDITKRLKVEEALRASEEQLRVIFDTVYAGVILVSQQGVILFANQRMADMFGYKLSELMGSSYTALVDTSEKSTAHEKMFQLIEGKIDQVLLERRYIRKNGTVFWGQLSGSRLLHPDGALRALVGVINDITERKRVEDDLYKSRLVLRSLIDALPLWLACVDTEGNYFVANKYYTETFKLPLEQIEGHNFKEFFPPALYEKHKRLLEQCMKNGAAVFFEDMHAFEENKNTYMYGVYTPLYDAEGKLWGVSAAVSDITERKLAEAEREKMEEQLRQSQKMEAIGTLAGGIAHDFNNILGAIIGFTEMSCDDLPQDSPVRHNLDQVLKSSLRARDLVKQILSFSRKTGQVQRPVQLHLIIAEAIKLLRASLPATIEIRDAITRVSDTIMADPTQIHQVLMNLCTNAAHAMRDRGGILTLGLHPVDLDSEDVSAYSDLNPGPYVRLTVQDTGTGIDPSIIDRIFDPFFTTKEVGRGTGMGLAVVHGIVKSHHGAVTVYSEPGKGTIFRVLFPRAESGEMKKEQESDSLIPKGSESILFVDDEELLVEIGHKLLETLGYAVTPVRGSVQALELFMKDPARFDLVITDQTMPHMTGCELAERLRAVRPDIRIILCTGYSETVSEKRAFALGIKAFIMKPMRRKEIAEAIRRVLDG